MNNFFESIYLEAKSKHLAPNEECDCPYCGLHLPNESARNRHYKDCDKKKQHDEEVRLSKKAVCEFCNQTFYLARRPFAAHRHQCALEHGIELDKNGRIKHSEESYKKVVQTRKELGLYGNFKGHHHTEETKEKLRKWAIDNQISFWPKATRKRSFAERYFDILFRTAETEVYVAGYWLDYAYPDKMIYFEVDGEQHYTEKGLEHDKVRKEKLESLGWILITRIRWSEYKKLSFKDKINKIKKIKELIKKAPKVEYNINTVIPTTQGVSSEDTEEINNPNNNELDNLTKELKDLEKLD